MKQKISHECGVDAGNICVIRLNALKKAYIANRDPGFLGKIFTVNPGKYNVTIIANNTWLGKVKQSKEMVFSETEEIYLGDACYLFNNSDHNSWLDFLEATEYLEKISSDIGMSINTGGDGLFKVSVTFDSVK